jgi:hypothetical protein
LIGESRGGDAGRSTPRAHLLEHTFRANPEYEFVPFRRLRRDDRQMVDDLSRDPAFQGILRPRTATTLGVKSASRELAALVRSLAVPGLLPAEVRRSADTHAADEIARLVLDGVLEVEHEGSFRCGASAEHLLANAPPMDDSGDDAIARLSKEALAYAEALAIPDAGTLSARMYFYNRKPITPRWAHRLPTPETTSDFLGLTGGSETASLLERHWTLASSEEPGGWLTWLPRKRRRERRRAGPTYKLYVSPDCEFVRDTFRIVVGTLAAHDHMVFKIGGDLAGLLRPDKIVVYFSEQDRLQLVAEQLGRALEGMPAHGVPFTASLDDRGLLSRGVDPPRRLKLLSWRETESWRLWTTNRLAVYMLTARATAGTTSQLSTAGFALARLRLDGVDTRTWSPTKTMWADPAHEVK